MATKIIQRTSKSKSGPALGAKFHMVDDRPLADFSDKHLPYQTKNPPQGRGALAKHSGTSPEDYGYGKKR